MTFDSIDYIPTDYTIPLPERTALVQPFCLGHGTLECYSLKASRAFYEEFLGLECRRHAKVSMAVRLGMRFHIVCVEVGDAVHPCNVLNHWGLDVKSAEEVDQAHAHAVQNQEKYGIRQILPVQEQHSVYSFYLEDRDHNWWEIQYYANGFQHDDLFDFGDRFPDDEKVDASDLPELQIFGKGDKS
jgi:catechol 2,3-dioxygenase-like lactoylglutathione lyase family enzyme